MLGKTERFDAIFVLEKKDGISVDTQIDECKKECSDEALVRIYQDVQQLINDIEQGIIKKVVVYKLSLWSRKISDFYKLFEIMKEHNCEFVSRIEDFNTAAPSNREMMGF